MPARATTSMDVKVAQPAVEAIDALPPGLRTAVLGDLELLAADAGRGEVLVAFPDGCEVRARPTAGGRHVVYQVRDVDGEAHVVVVQIVDLPEVRRAHRQVSRYGIAIEGPARSLAVLEALVG